MRRLLKAYAGGHNLRDETEDREAGQATLKAVRPLQNCSFCVIDLLLVDGMYIVGVEYRHWWRHR